MRDEQQKVIFLNETETFFDVSSSECLRSNVSRGITEIFCESTNLI